MIEGIEYINKEQTLIRVAPEGWIMPYTSKTCHKAMVTQWEDGRSDEWDNHKLKYDSYVAITTYDARAKAYDQCSLAHTGEVDRVLFCGLEPSQPPGYYTLTEVNKSILAHDAWVIAKNIWDDLDIDGTPFSQPEPVVCELPADVPVVIAPEKLIPNTIAPYEKPFSESVSEKKQELENAFDIASNADVNSNGTIFTGGYEAVMHMKNSAIFAKGRGSQKSIVHSKNNIGYDFTVVEIDKVAADLWENYHAAYVKIHKKLQELKNCPDGDISALNAINWDYQ